MAQKVSLKNIADKAGVSVAAVSLVLNGKAKNGRIGEQAVARIQQIASELNYKPNRAAQSLRTGKTKILGLIVADISNPFFAKLARHVENVAGANGYQVMFGSSDESKEKFFSLVDLFIEKSVDGIIVAPPAGCDEAVRQFERYNVPVVLIDRSIEGLPVSSVEIDNLQAACTLTHKLIEKGCRKIGFLAYNLRLSNIMKRYEGYMKALQECNISYDDRLVRSVEFENFDENIRKALDDLLACDIDSIVFATNRVGMQSLITLRKMNALSGLHFVSIDNPDEYKISLVPIICIEQPIEEMGERALDILLKQIRDPNYKIVERVILQSHLVV